MEIRENSKKIIRCLLDKAISQNSLNRSIDYEDIVKLGWETGIDNSRTFNVCIDYLKQKGLIKIIRTEGTVHITLTADAIDFLEVS